MQAKAAVHWSNQDNHRAGFWATVNRAMDEHNVPKNERNSIVHNALGVEHLADYAEPRAKAQQVVIAYLANMQPATDSEPVPERIRDMIPGAVTRAVAVPEPAPLQTVSVSPVNSGGNHFDWQASVTAKVFIDNHELLVTAHNGATAETVTATIEALMNGLRGVAKGAKHYATIMDGRNSVIVLKGADTMPAVNIVRKSAAGDVFTERIVGLRRKVTGKRGEEKKTVFDTYFSLSNGNPSAHSLLQIRFERDIETLYTLYPDLDFAELFPANDEEPTLLAELNLPDFNLSYKLGAEVSGVDMKDKHGNPARYKDVVSMELAEDEQDNG